LVRFFVSRQRNERLPRRGASAIKQTPVPARHRNSKKVALIMPNYKFEMKSKIQL